MCRRRCCCFVFVIRASGEKTKNENPASSLSGGSSEGCDGTRRRGVTRIFVRFLVRRKVNRPEYTLRIQCARRSNDISERERRKKISKQKKLPETRWSVSKVNVAPVRRISFPDSSLFSIH